MTDRELMQQVMENICGAKLCEINSMSSHREMFRLLDKAIDALRDRLAQPEQEPVAWMHNSIEDNIISHRPADLKRHPERWTALYPAPSPCPTCEALARTVMLDQTSHDTKRPWVGLTEEELYEIYDESDDGSSPCGVCGACSKCKIEVAIARAIEAKLKEKNK